jgi:hypothetical protein
MRKKVENAISKEESKEKTRQLPKESDPGHGTIIQSG